MTSRRIERAADKLRTYFAQGTLTKIGDFDGAVHIAKAILEAADTEEPEIVVTEDQRDAGSKAFMREVVEFDTRLNVRASVSEIYRAMRPLEPIPPFTEKMRAAMQAEFYEHLPPGALSNMYAAARALEGK